MPGPRILAKPGGVLTPPYPHAEVPPLRSDSNIIPIKNEWTNNAKSVARKVMRFRAKSMQKWKYVLVFFRTWVTFLRPNSEKWSRIVKNNDRGSLKWRPWITLGRNWVAFGGIQGIILGPIGPKMAPREYRRRLWGQNRNKVRTRWKQSLFWLPK